MAYMNAVYPSICSHESLTHKKTLREMIVSNYSLVECKLMISMYNVRLSRRVLWVRSLVRTVCKRFCWYTGTFSSRNDKTMGM